MNQTIDCDSYKFFVTKNKSVNKIALSRYIEKMKRKRKPKMAFFDTF